MAKKNSAKKIQSLARLRSRAFYWFAQMASANHEKDVAKILANAQAWIDKSPLHSALYLERDFANEVYEAACLLLRKDLYANDPGTFAQILRAHLPMVLARATLRRRCIDNLRRDAPSLDLSLWLEASRRIQRCTTDTLRLPLGEGDRIPAE